MFKFISPPILAGVAALFLGAGVASLDHSWGARSWRSGAATGRGFSRRRGRRWWGF